MTRSSSFALAAVSITTLALAGCTTNGYSNNQPQPAPPVAYQQVPAIVEVAERNGFRTGEADGSHDIYDGRPYRARATRAYHETPGYDQRVGPFDVYQNAFRNAYLRGYDKGYNRR